MTATASPIRKVAIAATLAGPVLVYCWALSVLSINVPVRDDHGALLDFLLRWRTSGSPVAAVSLVFEQFYSHRIPLTRLLVVVTNLVLGHLDLRVLQAFSCAGWILLAAGICRDRVRAGTAALFLVPVMFLLMQPQGSTNLLVATGSPGHAWCILLAYWSLRLNARGSGAAIAGATTLALASALCSVNGLLVFPLAAVERWLGHKPRQAAAWAVAGAVIWITYLVGYSVGIQPVASAPFSPVQLVLNTVVMAGAPAAFGTIGFPAIAVIGGGVCAAATLLVGRDLVARRMGPESMLLAFLMLSMLMISWARLGWASEYMMQDRYRFYPIVIGALLYLAAVDALGPARRRWFTMAATAIAAVFCVSSYIQNWAGLVSDRRWEESVALNLEIGRVSPLVLDADASEFGRILSESMRAGIYRPPVVLGSEGIRQIQRWSTEGAPGGTPTRTVTTTGSVFGLLIPAADTANGAPAFGLLVTDGKPLLLPVVVNRARLADAVTRGRLLGDSCAFLLPANQDSHASSIVYSISRHDDGALSILWSARIKT